MSMKGVTAIALLAAPCGCTPTTGSTLVNDPEHIRQLNEANENEASSWRAGPSKFFEGMTFDDAKVVLGAHLSHIDNHLNETAPDSHYYLADNALPKNFDSREQWKGLIHPIRDQERCGSCWAFSASEVLSDRDAIASGKESPVLSAEDMISCDKGDHGCGGGMLPHAWAYLTSTGIVTDSCYPYSAGSGKAPACSSTCSDSESFTKYKAQNSYAIKGPVHMAKDIVQHGPIQIGFMVYRSFMSYKSGIYHKLKSEKSPEGGHAVKIIGFGIDGGKKYWLVANSWNTNWGEDGFFRILRGKDECGIETMGPPYAGLPASSASDLIVV